MTRAGQLAVVVLGLAVALWGGLVLAYPRLASDQPAPPVVVTEPATPTPTADADGEGRLLASGTVTVRRVLREGSDVGGVVLLVVGLGLTTVAWPRRRKATPPA